MGDTVHDALDALEHYATTVGEHGRRDGDAARIASGDYLLDHILTVRRGLLDQPVMPATGAPNLSDLGNDAVMLLGLCEGLDVMNDAQDGDPSCPVARQARNAMVPLIAAVIEKARRLADDIDAAERTTRKGRAG